MLFCPCHEGYSSFVILAYLCEMSTLNLIQIATLFWIHSGKFFILIYPIWKNQYNHQLFVTVYYFCAERLLIFSHIPPFDDVMKDFGSNSSGCFVFSHTLNSKFDRRTVRPILVCSNPKRIPVMGRKQWFKICQMKYTRNMHLTST